MPTSGIEVPVEIKSWYEEGFKRLKQNAYFFLEIKGKNKLSYVEDGYGDALCDESEETNEKVFNEMAKKLPDDKPMFIFFDFHFKTKDGRDENKLALISWAPECCKVAEKMIHSSTLSAVSAAFKVNKTIQVNDRVDFTFEEMKSQLLKK